MEATAGVRIDTINEDNMHEYFDLLEEARFEKPSRKDLQHG